MISINELRIGNLVENDGHPYNVKGIRSCDPADYNEVIVESGGIRYVFRAEDLKPIPITEEILLGCGFKMKKGRFFNEWIMEIIDCPYIRLIPAKEASCDYWVFVPDIQIEWSISIGYLHQLQNLVFLITNKEMAIGQDLDKIINKLN